MEGGPMHDDQLRGLLRTLENDREPDPQFADALYGRLQFVARGERRARGPMLLLAAALLALLAGGLALGSGLVPLPLVVETSATPEPTGSADPTPAATEAPSATPAASLTPSPDATPTAPTELAGETLFVDADGLRLRAGPSSDDAIVATLRRGQLLGATGSVEGDWIEVRIGPGSVQGWVSRGPDGSWLRRVTDGVVAFSSGGQTEAQTTEWVIADPLSADGARPFGATDVVDVTWSPDGSRVALTVRVPGGAGGMLAVELADADGGNRQRLDGAAYGPAWSPDGTRLAWTGASGLVVTDTSLTPAILQTDLRGPSHPMWSPDGTRLAVTALDCPACPTDEPIMGDPPTAVFVVDIATGRSTKVTDPGYYDLAGWSADGSRLSIAAMDLSGERPQQAFTVAADGGPLQPLLEGAFQGAARWSPDGTSLAVATPNGVVVMDGNGGNERLVHTDAFVGSLRWSPSGQWLVYQASDSVGADIGLWVTRADGSEPPRRLTSTEIAAGQPEWQPVLAPIR
jgi:Tol biopolymer transport system component